ncbi:MAG TPA: FliM/FliN family flagellar motor switch protein [Tabrizicola sp.]
MTDVIRRKIDRARPTQAEGAPGADRGWRLALARAARDAMGLDLEFRSLSIARRTLEEILEIAPERALIGLLDGPQGGVGIIMLAPSVTATFIEKQTLGRLSAQPPVPRKASRIDAAMVASVIDRALAGLDEALAGEHDLTWAGGFRYASYLEDVRPLALMLEEDAYRVLSALVTFGTSGREGQVILVLPAAGRGEQPAPQPGDDGADAPQFTSALAAQVLQADCRLDAVIARLTLPLRQLMSLQVGEVLTLPQAGLDVISVETIDGRPVASARLGQHRGMRAVKLNEAVAVRSAAPAPYQQATPATADPPTAEYRAAG